jgi:thiosulfate/3-mercaptopyruvate sulfurtransferase
MPTDPLVSTRWLAEHLRDPNLRVVDIRGFVTTRPVGPGVETATYRGAREEYLAGHIPGASYIDWTTDITDPLDSVPAQIAPPDRFAEAMSVRGIGNDAAVIAVDHTGGQFATRLWWALRYYGHDDVAVLDGGWNRWVDEGHEIESGEVTHTRAVFTPQICSGLRVTAEQVAEMLEQPGGDTLLVDARDPGQYSGARRRGLRGGHIPGAINVPRELFFAPEGGFLALDEIRRRVEEHGLSAGKRTIAYCNGGVAATAVLFNLARLGYLDLANFDGSWNEWGERLELPVEA